MLDLSDEELQTLVTVVATASGPGINWMLTNGILTKLQGAAQGELPLPTKPRKPNSEDHDATLPRR